MTTARASGAAPGPAGGVGGIVAAVVAMCAMAAVLRAAPGAAAPPPGGAPAAAPAAAPSPTVRIVFTVIPSARKAMVWWGKRRLGVVAPHAPLVVERPRDSGPLDLMVRAEGCAPVQTRAYTFADNKVVVKLTPLDQVSTLLGYREELPPDGGAGPPPQSPDGGVP